MKWVVTTIVLTWALIAASTPVWAQTTSPSATPATSTPTAKMKQIEDLKERLATKVAELRQSQRRALFGTVTSISLTTVTIETQTKNVKIELTDDMKVIQVIRGKRTELTTDALDKGDTVVVFGDYDATIDILKGKIIFIQGSLPVRISGTVTAIDKGEFTLTVETAEGQTYTVDIEKDTRTEGWDRTKGLSKSGFSKIALGDTVHILGTPVPKKDNRLSAQRIFNLGNLSGVTPTPSPTLSEEATTSATPTTTPKTTPKPTPKSAATPTPAP